MGFWKFYEKHSKALLAFLRNDCMMDPVRASAAAQGLSAPFIKIIKKTSGRWAKWRMGTVCNTSRKLDIVLQELYLVFEPSAYKSMKDGVWFGLVNIAITSIQRRLCTRAPSSPSVHKL